MHKRWNNPAIIFVLIATNRNSANKYNTAIVPLMYNRDRSNKYYSEIGIYTCQ